MVDHSSAGAEHTFHAGCDGKGATVVVAKTELGRRFGGVADKSWSSETGYVVSDAAFLFCLDCHGPLVQGTPAAHQLKLTSDNYNYALFHTNASGPTFGGGHDLKIQGKGFAGPSDSDLGSTYECPVGQHGSALCEQYMAGNATKAVYGVGHFLAADYEVYVIKGSPTTTPITITTTTTTTTTTITVPTTTQTTMSTGTAASPIASATASSAVGPPLHTTTTLSTPAPTTPTCYTPEQSMRETVKIGCFNVQIFGVGKMAKPAVAGVLADMTTLYDLLIIQEIRDANGKAILDLLEQANAKQAAADRHRLVLSPRCVRASMRAAPVVPFHTGLRFGCWPVSHCLVDLHRGRLLHG